MATYHESQQQPLSRRASFSTVIYSTCGYSRTHSFLQGLAQPNIAASLLAHKTLRTFATELAAFSSTQLRYTSPTVKLSISETTALRPGVCKPRVPIATLGLLDLLQRRCVRGKADVLSDRPQQQRLDAERDDGLMLWLQKRELLQLDALSTGTAWRGSEGSCSRLRL